MQILAILGHIEPVFGLLLPWCSKVPLSIFFQVLSGMSDIGKKILNNNDQFAENANFGHFRLFLACFWPLTNLVWPPDFWT